ADDETEQRRETGHKNRLDEDAEIERLERAQIIGEGAADIDAGQARILAEAVGPDNCERSEEERDHPDDGWQGRCQEGQAAFLRLGGHGSVLRSLRHIISAHIKPRAAWSWPRRALA